jgi:hypothetical protein
MTSTNSYVKNAADKKQVRKAAQKEQSRRDKELNDLRFILNDVQGRRFLWRYLGECGVFRSSFTGSSETFFREGERNVGLKLINDIHEASPEAYILMIKENKESEDKDV